MEQTETKIKRPRRTFKEWWAIHKPSKRRLIQIYAALLYNANIKGYIKGEIYTSATTKYTCVPGLNCYSCPGAVGACPLGALQNALAESNTRAPYYILGILALFGLMLARTICGFLCPVGLGQELLYFIRTPKLKKSRFTRVLSYFKYVILVLLVIIIPLMYALRDVPLPAFCKYICPAGTIGGAIGLLIHPDNGDMFAMLGGQFVWKFSLLVVFIVASIFIFRFFCRFFCPLGAIYGFFNKIALIGVKVDHNACTNCGKCVAVCKMDVKCVGDHECINCGQCMSVCPTKAIGWKGAKLFNLKAPEVTEPQVDETAAVDVNAINKRKLGKKDKKFWLELTAWIVALVVLVGALVYYNFIDVAEPYVPPEIGTNYKVGDTASDFTVQLYGTNEQFIFDENIEKHTVIYFWATSNTQSTAYLPFYNELAEKHPDWNVLAIHGDERDGIKAADYISKNCSDWTLTFAQDKIYNEQCITYALFGGKEELPLTVVVNKEGTIVYNKVYEFSNYEELETEIQEVANLKKGYNVGDIAPDFTVKLYGSEDSFTLYEHRGKVVIVNFWATWCTPCVNEIPYFNEFAVNHPEIDMVAIHGSSTQDVNNFINNKNWTDYALPFAQDNIDGKTCVTFQMLGGKSMWPMTVIIDAEGKVIYNSTNSFESYEDLEQLVMGLIETQK